MGELYKSVCLSLESDLKKEDLFLIIFSFNFKGAFTEDQRKFESTESQYILKVFGKWITPDEAELTFRMCEHCFQFSNNDFQVPKPVNPLGTRSFTCYVDTEAKDIEEDKNAAKKCSNNSNGMVHHVDKKEKHLASMLVYISGEVLAKHKLDYHLRYDIGKRVAMLHKAMKVCRKK